MGIETAHVFKAAFKKNSNTWGSGLPVVVGSGDGFEFNSESIKANVALINNEGFYGAAYRRPGSPGNKTPGGDADYDFYYRCNGGLRQLACAAGADSVAALGGGAHEHTIALTDTHSGVFGTLVLPGNEGIREYPFAKLTGMKMRWDESKQRGKLMPTYACFDEFFNVGSPVDNFVVVSVTAVNGALTITAGALAGFNASPIFMTKDAGVTALTVVLVALDRKGNQYTRTFTQTDFVSNVFTDTEYVKKVISITLSGVAGSGNVKVGVTNGVNNATTVAAITTDTDRDCTLFSQMDFFINDQGGADFVAADEQFLAALEIGLQLSPDSRVTTLFGDRIEEPTTGGAGRPQVTVGINFSAFTDRNRRFLLDRVGKTQLKAVARFTGPPIAASGFAHRLEIWLNGIQLAEGDPNIGGPGVLPFDLQGEAHTVVAVPTGFPGGFDEAMTMRIRNGFATSYLA